MASTQGWLGGRRGVLGGMSASLRLGWVLPPTGPPPSGRPQRAKAFADCAGGKREQLPCRCTYMFLFLLSTQRKLYLRVWSFELGFFHLTIHPRKQPQRGHKYLIPLSQPRSAPRSGCAIILAFGLFVGISVPQILVGVSSGQLS